MNQNNTTLSTMEKEERPYEKCERMGASYLTDTELLAVLLRTGSCGEDALELSRRILYHLGEDGILGLHHFKYEQLIQIRGIGHVKAIQILCISELSKRLAKARATKSLSFHDPSSVAKYFMEDMRHLRQEVMKLLMLDTKTHLIGVQDISKGTVNASLITPREIYIEALQNSAVSIILIHNHPSGDPSPSNEDILLTERISHAGELVGIELLDHIVIGDNCFCSIKELKLFSMKG